MKNVLFVCGLFLSCITYAQTNVRGTVVDEAGVPVVGANVVAVGTTAGTATDFDGNFALLVDAEPPFNLEVSSIGYALQKVAVTANNQSLSVTLVEGSELDEVVISASRTPERIFESPVTIERFGLKEIKNTASADFYDGLENLKGVDINTNSLTFKSINTRGFATFANTRFMQLVDGMDNAAPALNFPLGNLLGMTDTDVQSVEILPGAASALYGANAFNGILFMRSKSPFDHQGISVSLKQGQTSQTFVGDNPYTDVNFRVGHKFSEKLAVKINGGYLSGTDWGANNYDGKVGTGSSRADINYDGVNVYGDEVSTNIRGVAQALENLGILPNGASALVPSENISRTGYNEVDLMPYEAKSVKFGGSLNYRPFGDESLEVIWNSKFGTGNTIYQGTNRYAIQNFFLEQHKLEIVGKNFFVRGYLTDEDAGNSFDTRFAAININRQWKDDNTWFGEYVGAYVLGTLGGLTSEQAHGLARQTAESGRLLPGTEGFKAAFDKVTNDPDLVTGSKFQDNTRLYHVDANYNFRDMIDWAEFQIGGSYRVYSLNSQGSIFTDYDGPISYNEYGVYTQMQKKFMDEDRLKLTASIRYDKAQNFDGNYSPRVSLAYAAGENKNQNFRASFQTGFRNPTTQDQYIGLNAGRAYLVGSAPDNLDRYLTNPLTVSGAGQILGGLGATTQVSGRSAYENAFSASSVVAGNPTAIDVALVRPERVTAWEVGYRGLIPAGEKNITVDMSVYYNSYEDFIAGKNVLVPFYGNTNFSDTAPIGPGGSPVPLALAALANGDFVAFQTYTNSAADISSYGASIGINTKILGGFDFGLNYTYAKFDFDKSTDPDFEAGFNTPEHKVKVQFGKNDLFENFGFNINARWQDEYLWESTFHDAVIDSRTVIDMQINYRIPSMKSIIKLGGANLMGQEYFSAPGVGAIGSQYYLSWTINN